MARRKTSKKIIGLAIGTALGLGASGHFATEAAHKSQMAQMHREAAAKTGGSRKQKHLKQAKSLTARGKVHSYLAPASIPLGAAVGLGVGALKDRKKRRNARKKQRR